MSSNHGYPGFVEDRAIIEVGKVLEAVRKYGAYSSVAFDIPTTQAVIARTYGGWARLCSECNTKGFRREFARAWVAYFRQDVRLFGHLPGIIETTNRKNGFYEHIPPPKLIGDPELALAMLNAQETFNLNDNRDAEGTKASSSTSDHSWERKEAS